ncbi:hypothetical protein KKA47_07100 [bacterium]|nr:hypothetical protein [bacterium]
MAGIGVILNPHSRSNRKNPERVKKLSFIVGDKGSCRATHDSLDVPNVLSEFKEKSIDVLGISGGDGTLHYVLTEMLKVYGKDKFPKIALLRGGTMNNAAQALGVAGTPEKILSNLIYKYHAGDEFKMTRVHLMNVNGMHGFLFGMGLVSRCVEIYYEAAKHPSPLTALMVGCRIVGSFLLNTEWANGLCKRFDAKVVVDGKEWPFKNYVAVTSGTVETFGFGFNPFYRTRTEPGRFQSIGISLPPRTLLCKVLNSFLSRPINSENSLDEMASKVEITCSEPHKYTIDGELFGPVDKITVEVGPLLDVIIG